MASSFARAAATLVAIQGALPACQGRLSDRPVDVWSGGPGVSGECEAPQGSLSPLRRLTRPQYENAVSFVFGPSVRSEGVFPASDLNLARSGLSGEADANVVTTVGAERIEEAALGVAEQVMDQLATLLPCAADPLRTSCLRGFVERYGSRAFRRPLTASEVAQLVALGEQAALDGPEIGVGAVTAALLQSPSFLYLPETLDLEPGASPDLVPLSGLEIAQRLSFMLWNSPADEVLTEAAEAGELDSDDALVAQAKRMLRDPRAASPLASFVREWARFDRIDSDDRPPNVLSAELAASVQTSFDSFVVSAIQTGDLAELLTSSRYPIDSTMAAYYGVSAAAQSGALAPVDLSEQGRRGLLTQPALLMGLSHREETSYVKRGAFVLEKLLCQALPPAPADAQARVPPSAPDASSAERSLAIRSEGECGRCHSRIDPIGLGLEGFDSIGRPRTQDRHGNLISPGGQLPYELGSFESASQLAEVLASSRMVSDCVSLQFLRFALSRVESDFDACAQNAIAESFQAQGGRFEDLVAAIVTSPAFRVRRLSATDGTQE